jgi:hypothetical protein
MKELTRLVEALESIGAELERLRILKEHELDARVGECKGGHGPYVPATGGSAPPYPRSGRGARAGLPRLRACLVRGRARGVRRMVPGSARTICTVPYCPCCGSRALGAASLYRLPRQKTTSSGFSQPIILSPPKMFPTASPFHRSVRSALPESPKYMARLLLAR